MPVFYDEEKECHIYIEDYLSPNIIVKIAKDVIKYFGFKEDDLIIETADIDSYCKIGAF